MKIHAILAASALMLGACGAPASEAGNFVNVEADDPAMQAAHAEAQRTFSAYLRAAAAPAPGTQNYMVKVKIADRFGVEHFWVKDVGRDGAGFAGVIDNAPVTVKSVKLGQRYAFGADDISDWMYMKDGKIHGGYTIRALAPKLPPEKQAAIKAMMAPL